MGGRVGSGLPAAGELADHTEHAPQELADGTAATDGARKRIVEVLVVVCIIVGQLSQRLFLVLAAWDMCGRLRLLLRGLKLRQDLSRGKAAEDQGRVGDGRVT
jgi:hypothetical protein